MMILYFFAAGAVILAPEFLWWLFVSRPRQKRLKKQQELTGRYWRIRNMEMDIYGEWKS